MKKKLNNKGFSLVELIIVIAIMAALVAILAPQYMKYVDKSRKQADATTAEEIFTACKIAATDESVTEAFTATWNGTTLVITTTNAQKAVSENLGKTYPTDGISLAAKFKGTKTTAYLVTYTPAAAASTSGGTTTPATEAKVEQSGGWWAN